LKAELFSSDFIISILLFISIIAIAGLYYQNLQTDVYDSYIRNDMQTKAMNVASLLATTSGDPKYWDSSNVKVIGIYDSGRFNLTKFAELKEIDYTTSKRLLGINYELNITLKNETGNVLESNGVVYSFGIPLIDVKQSVLVKRLGLVEIEGNVSKVIMEVLIWT
jgi:hypothetical protein